MIEKVNWDSDFFGYSIGKVNLNTKEDYYSFLEINKKEHRLIYVFSKNELEIENQSFKKVDDKLTYIKFIENINKTNINDSIKKVELNKNNFDSILQLAYLSGKYSRFNMDENFKNDEYKRMYKIWITNTNQNKNIIVKYSNSDILGFVLYSIKGSTINIELISVAEKTQGQGIGTELIKEIEQIGIKNHCNKIEVVTQGVNLPAIGLYTKNNFNLVNSVLIYHYWNL